MTIADAPVVRVDDVAPSRGSAEHAVRVLRPRRQRAHGFRGSSRLIGVALFFAVWSVATGTGYIDSRTLATPVEVGRTALDLLRSGDLQTHLWASLQRVLWGLGFGISTGVVLSLLAGLLRAGEAVVDGPVQILRTLPVLALQPLFVLWFGIGEEMKVILISYAVTFPIYINTYAAIRGIDNRFVEVARSVRLGRWAFVRKIVLRGALPGFLVGLRYALAVSWLVLILAEAVNASSGLGFMVNRATFSGQTSVIVLALAIYGTLGLLGDLLTRAAERHFLRWQVTLGSAR